MADLAPTDPRLTNALGYLDFAAARWVSPVFEEHTQAINGTLDALNKFYLHIDVPTGNYDPAPIYADPSKTVYGLIPAAVAPLLELLERQTRKLEVWRDKYGRMSEAQQITMKRWRQRLDAYHQTMKLLELGDMQAPSELLWTRITAPLLQGFYPQDFDVMGIANPAVRSRPDVVTPAIETFGAALREDLVDNIQLWLLEWEEDAMRWRDSMTQAIRDAIANVAEEATEKARRAFFWTLGTFALVGVGWWALQRTRNKKWTMNESP